MSEAMTYTPRGDYLLPNLMLDEPPRKLTEPLGRYARMRKVFLKTHRTITYNTMLLSESLFRHLRETQALAETRIGQMIPLLAEMSPPPDKETDPMGWTAAMNALKAQAEEMVLNELIYA